MDIVLTKVGSVRFGGNPVRWESSSVRWESNDIVMTKHHQTVDRPMQPGQDHVHWIPFEIVYIFDVSHLLIAILKATFVIV